MMDFAKTASGDWIATRSNVVLAIIMKTDFRYRVAKFMNGAAEMHQTWTFKDLNLAKNWCKKELS